MDAKEYLNEIRRKMKRKAMWEDQLDRIDDLIGTKAIQYTPDKVQSSPKKDGLENEAINHLERREEIIEKINTLITEIITAQAEALEYIGQIESDDQREVLILRYVECKQWWDIADQRDRRDISSQMELRDRGLVSLQKILDANTIPI